MANVFGVPSFEGNKRVSWRDYAGMYISGVNKGCCGQTFRGFSS